MGADVRQALNKRKAAVAAAWFESIARTSFIALGAASLRGQLTVLAERAIDALLEQPFRPAEAVRIGAELGRLRYAQPAVLGDAVEALLREVASALPAPELAALWPSLAALLRGIAAGFAEGQRAVIVAEQGVIHRALFVTRAWAEDALRASEARFRAMFEGAPIGMLLTDGVGTILETNRVLQEMVGYSPEELRGMAFTRILHPDDGETDLKLAKELMTGRRDRYQLEERYIRKDGQVVWGHLSVSVLQSASGKREAAIRMVKDVTARKHAEDALRVSEDRYRAVVTQVEDAIVLTDAATGSIVEANPAFQRLLGYTAAELVGLPLHRLVAHRRSSVLANIAETLRRGRHDLHERRCRRKDGRVVTVEASVTAVNTNRGTLLCAVVRDISERQRAEAELCAARAALAESREAERLRLARDLHDGVVQELLGLRYQLVAGADRLTGGGPESEVLATAGVVEHGLARVVGDLRGLIGELRPPGIDESGLQGALENCVASLTKGRGPVIQLDVAEGTRSLSRSTAVCLFRVAQEAVRNAIEHAQAQRVVVRVRPRATSVLLSVSDDGCGFVVPERLDLLARHGHFGLSGMEERVRWSSGRLRIRSWPGRGTTVTAWLPLGRSEVAEEDKRGEYSSSRG